MTPNPRQNANFLALVTFFFTFDLLKKGWKRDIERKDIYDVPNSFECGKLSGILEKHWLKEKSKILRPSLLRFLWKIYGKYYMFLGITQFFASTTMLILQPYVLGKFISYFTTHGNVTNQSVICYGSLLIILNFFISIYNHNYYFLMTEMAIRIKAAISSMLYKKILKLKLSSQDRNTGKIVTLITKDLIYILSAITALNDIWIIVLQIVVAIYMIYTRFQLTALIGALCILLIVITQALVGKWLLHLRRKANKVTDHRLLVLKEVFSAIKIIKIYVWEKFFKKKISNIRDEEVKLIRFVYFAKAVSLAVGGIIFNVALCVIVIIFTNLGNIVKAEDMFFLVGIFQMLKSSVTVSLSLNVSQFAEVAVSLQRITSFLLEEEFVDSSEKVQYSVPFISLENAQVIFKETKIIYDISLLIKTPSFTVVTGEHGSGKSSLLKTILKEYSICTGRRNVQGLISYAPQEPWLFPSTIKENIVFGQNFDECRYQKVLEICELKEDIDNFENEDEIILEDYGMNLSKGQKARINLARAVYRNSDIYLLDDCLSSIDARVKKNIVQNCIKKFLSGKIVIVTTHAESLIQEADNVVLMEDGTIKWQGIPSELVFENTFEKKFTEEENEKNHYEINVTAHEDVKEAEEVSHLIENFDQKCAYDETKKTGSVDPKVYKQYFRYGGGFIFFGFIICLFIISQIVNGSVDKLLSAWINIEEKISDFNTQNATNTTEFYYLLQKDKTILSYYVGAMILTNLLIFARICAIVAFSAKASKRLHKKAVESIIESKMEFFDSHYIGNIINRLSRDLANIDEYLPLLQYNCLKIVCIFVNIIILIIIVNLSFLIFAFILSTLLYFIRRCYIPIGRSLKRLENATLSPVVGHVSISLEGLAVIRAHDAKKLAQKIFNNYQNIHTSATHMMYSSLKAYSFVLDLLCNFFTAAIIIRFLIHSKDTSPGDVGLAVTQSFMLTGLLWWGFGQWAELENQMTAVERVTEYVNVEQENKSGQTIEHWPSQGSITFQNVYLSYSGQKHNVLKNINLAINSGGKIGIVGRTGAGKSSLISILLRLYDYTGKIYIDDVDIKTLSVDFLRSRIAFIPQDPVLFSESIRQNIDPINRYTDEEIWKAVDILNLKTFILNLDDKNCDNFSCGHKQLICLVRAFVNKSKIVILDEATANVDHKTDKLVQTIVHEHFVTSTVIIIAHRLQSLSYCKKVIVVKSGEIVEFDKFEVLQNNIKSHFYKLMRKKE